MPQLRQTLMLLFIIAYLLALVAAFTVALSALFLGLLPPDYERLRVILGCCAVAGMGGCLYCLRAVYINKCVYKRWDADWYVWYFLRPVTSILSGGASFLFLKAGLLVLESSTRDNATEIGFYALAFIAGLNVDKFVGKIEAVAQAVWGIEKSRASGEIANPVLRPLSEHAPGATHRTESDRET